MNRNGVLAQFGVHWAKARKGCCIISIPQLKQGANQGIHELIYFWMQLFE
jgi:hypothetical protein